MIEQRIYGAPLDSRVLFALHPAIEVDTENGIQPLVDNAGDFLYWGAGAPTYTTLAPARPPSPDRLREAEGGFSPSERHFLQLPPLDPAVRELADSLTAGASTRYDQAMAIQRWLQGFQYTRELPARASETSLEYFLFERQAGHCEYFSTAMVVMLRAIGIEARNVNGFLGGQWSQFGNYLAVTQNAAHSWVEVWFPEYGWVTFDPTPAGTGSGTATTSWLWPGRILFDGIQHRWSKWVLDYGSDDQSGLLSRWSGIWTADGESGSESGAPSSSPDGGSYPLRIAGLLALLGIGWWLAGRGRARQPPAARLYLTLRKSCARAGLHVTSGTTARELLRTVDANRPAASAAARRVVELYLRTRWGGEPLRSDELREMRSALRAARSDLRAKSEAGPAMSAFPGVREAPESVSS